MRGIWRVLTVWGVTLIAFVVAVVVLQDDARAGCVTSAPPDPSYEAELIDEVETSATSYRIEITRDGEPVTGATVCINVAMMGMNAMGSSDTAEEIDPGVYEISVVFEMRGRWEGDLLIAKPGRSAASLQLDFEVE
ncbi:hypothetical protein BH18ACT4_BH18ACT4_14720 [soil metagenome]